MTGANPTPVAPRFTTVLAEGTLLAMVTAPETLPVAEGWNATGKVMLCPGGSATGNVGLAIEYPFPDMLIFRILNTLLPQFRIVAC